MAKQEQTPIMIIEEREELMISLNCDEPPKSKLAHFLHPTLNPKDHQLVPKHPSFTLPSKPNIKIQCMGSPTPQKGWHLWVGNMQQIHENTWKKVGIFDAIRASTYNILKDNELIIGLAKYWCDEAKAFIFPWGECTITLEDVMILGGFSVLGENVHTPFQSKEVEEVQSKLMSVFPERRKNSVGRIPQQAWMNFFMDSGGDLEHIALIVLWLSRYVFPKKNYSQILPSVVPIAISLVRGTRIALAPAVLASLYQDMSLLKHEMVSCVNEMSLNTGSSKHIVWSPIQLVQLWGWERFQTLGPKPITLFRGEPRLARWQNIKRVKNGLIVMDFEVLGDFFVWRPYALSIENWDLPQFYGDEERWVLMGSEVGEEFFSFARCLMPCELVGLGCIEQYLPHRVGLQFGLDQDIPCSIQRLNGSVELAWSTYDVSLDGLKLYLAPRLLQGAETTVRYFTWSRTAFHLSTRSTPVFNMPRILRRRSTKKRVTRSQNLEVIILDSSGFALDECLPSTLSNVPLASCSMHGVGEIEGVIGNTTSCDRRAPTLGNNHGDSECLPSQSPKDANNKSAQNVKGNVQDSNKVALPCLSFSNVVGSALVGSTEEEYVEMMPSSEKNCNLNRICDDDGENTASLSLQNAIEKAVIGMDTLMEQLGICKEDCVSMSSNRLVDSVEAKYNKITLPCNNDMSPTKSPDNCGQGLPSQSTQRDADEVATLTDTPMAELMKILEKIQEDTNCIKTGIDSRLLEGARPQDDILTANANDHVSKVEPDKKKLCLVSANDERGKAAKFAGVKSGNDTLDDKVVIIVDDEGEREQNDFDSVEVLCSKQLQFEARISKLEKVVSKMQAKRLKSKEK